MSSELVEGPTPNGGAYAILCFFDDDHNDTERGTATRSEIVEYNADGEQVWRTYAELQPRQREGNS